MNIGGLGGYSPASGLASRILGQADADVDGALSLEEFAATGETSEDEVSDIFSTLDSDGDGLVGGDELATGIQTFASEAAGALLGFQEFGAGGPPPPPGGGPGGGSFFSDTDADASGTLSLDEFSAKGEEIGMASEDAAALFEAIDADGDGEIDEDENAAFEQTMSERGAGGPPRGGPPPGGPPPGGAGGGSGSGVDLASLLAGNSAYGSSSTIDLTQLFDQAA